LRVATRKVTLGAHYARTNPEARSGEFICLEVNDTGTGITPEVLPHIFEPFFTTKEAGKGTGLGLATVHGVVKRHQGWIEVGSRLKGGTTFKIYLPVIKCQSAPARAQAVPSRPADGKETILLVEDELSVRAISRRVLEKHGYKVLEASSAPEAMALWKANSERISLLLTDVVMPNGLTGFGLAEQLCIDRPGLKTIFMSGYSPGSIGPASEFLRARKGYFLQKPCGAQKLVNTVRQCLDSAGS
jgi:CheY-like chemotaxis protein